MIKILIAERIDELMKEQGLSQTKLGDKIGVSQSSVSEWLSKKIEPSIHSLWRLADFFGVTVDYLIGREDL